MRILMTVAGCIVLIGCANMDPIVDKKGVNETKYQQDLAQCKQYAAGINTGAEASKHGAAGAAVGGILGAIVGDSTTAGQGAGVGAVTGSVRGARKAEYRKERVIQNCLQGRGYRVLG